MALGGHQQRTPVPVAGPKRPSVGGSLQALRLKRPDFAILPPLLTPPSEANNNNAISVSKSSVSSSRRRRSSADDAVAKMANAAAVIDRTDVLKVSARAKRKSRTHGCLLEGI
jgi:hypothetical protein